MHSGFLRSSPSGQRGQILPIVAIAFVALAGFGGLALDAGHVYLVQRNVQAAADAATLSAGKKLMAALQNGPPADSNNAAVRAAHDWATANGFSTVWNTVCDRSTAGAPRLGLTQFSTTWYDTAAACGATSGFTTSVSVYSPPQTLTLNCQVAPYNCLQVVVSNQVSSFIMGALGQPQTLVAASAVAYAQPANGAFSVPVPIALYLYQPQAGCGPLTQQCFDETKPPTRSLMSCRGTANCPTMWVQPGSNPLIEGINGNLVTPIFDWTAVQSNGDVVLQDATGTTICDPTGFLTCTAGTATGAHGLAMASATKLYCSAFGGGSTSNTTPPCTVPGPGGASEGPLNTNETPFSPQSWTAIVDTPVQPYCAALVLNGGIINNSFVGAPAAACQGTASEPYTIRPGRYDYIVVNHGRYDFEGGLYEITNVAPVNTNTMPSQYANGIDHSNEAAADWDLCTTAGGILTACGGPSPLTAGIWIGHGSMNSVASTGGGSVGTCEDGDPQIGQTGGGDATIITANGALFRFDGPQSGGFVSTHEVTSIAMVGPAPGSIIQARGSPLLFDLENDSFIHLDSLPTTSSYFKGIIYQAPGQKYGGVEVNPGLAGGSSSAIGQVWAYTFTTFGTAGIALDFSRGLGSASSSSLITTGEEEQEILTSASLIDTGRPGFETLVVQYNDEWALDAYNAYVKINTGNPRFFSQGIWNPVPPAGSALPPAGNVPGDNNPARPAAAQDPTNKYTHAGTPSSPDWTMTYADGSTFEVNGNWMWGHEESLVGAVEGSNAATLSYTFPTPPGGQVTITLFMSDGDSCGDFATATWTFNNVVPPNPGTQVAGTVRLEQ